VLAALGEHLTNRDIARRLHLSIRTVESHVSSLLHKLDVADRRALAVIAARLPDSSHKCRPFRGLPTPWTSFVGRAAELHQVTAAVGANRLVTLLGPGGIGKTRLAAVAAERVSPAFGGGGAFVDLLAVTGDSVETAVAAALGAVDRPQTPRATVIHEQLGWGPALVVLDNCEHVLESAVAWVEETLAACPDLVVLATSRERLGVAGERVVVVPPMQDDAAVLFVERATASGSDLNLDRAAVTEICRRLEGSPLAIELAAARLGSLGVDGLRVGLEDSLRLLGHSGSPSGPASRHRSLRAVIGWSHDLLDPQERTLFRRVGMFAGAFDLPAVTVVAAGGDAAIAADVIGRLADKSLLEPGRGGSGSRWRMLDTVRGYAREQLVATQEEIAIEEAHLRWAVSAAAALEAELGEDDAWVAEFDDIADDLRAAFVRPAPMGTQHQRFALGLSLAHLAYARGLFAEARGHYVDAAQCAPDPAAAIVAWRGAAAVAQTDQRLSLAVELFRQAAAAADACGDPAATARILADIARQHGRFPSGLDVAPDREATLALIEQARNLDPGGDPVVRVAIALAAAWNGRPKPTEPDPVLATESLALAQELGDPLLLSEALDAVTAAASFAGRRQEAKRIAAERLRLVEHLPRHSPSAGLEIFDAYHAATETAIAAGDLNAALNVGRRAQAEHRLDVAVPYQAASRVTLALVLRGDFEEALAQAERMRDTWVRAGRPTAGWMANAVVAAAMIHGLRDETALFDEWWQIATDLAMRSSTKETLAFVTLRIALHHGRLADLPLDQDSPPPDGNLADYARCIGVEVAVVTAAVDAPAQIRAALPLARENAYAAGLLQRASGRLQRDPSQLEAAVTTWETIGARFERACTLTLLPTRREEGARELAQLGCPMPATAN
jgi:predicted ATPase